MAFRKSFKRRPSKSFRRNKKRSGKRIKKKYGVSRGGIRL